MTITSKFAALIAVFLGFSGSVAGNLMAQGANPGAGPAGGGPGYAGAAGQGGIPNWWRTPLEFEVQIDAMDFIDDWRAAQRYSQIETPRRSGVYINGTRVGAGNPQRQVLFACTGNAFLDLTVGIQQPDGSVIVDDGPSVGCEPRQALVRKGDRLACNWYSPPVRATGAPAAEYDAQIILATVPPVSIVGQCITGAAQVVPALVFPQGRSRRAGRGVDCGGSGVSVNGRVTGQRANCYK